ncbi:MAG TPA: phospholipase [Candidatus Limnocylindria bacterium]|nr:phospholipase [Candidatus Limnocylindria bacterium]
MASLTFQERGAEGPARGLLVLHHGRGTDEFDLLPVADIIDPQRRLHVVTPRGPLSLPGSPGRHWYVVRSVGSPDRETFGASLGQLGELLDELWQRTGLGPESTVLGGFSQGTVMSYALGLDADRPAPAGILAVSGFIPTVEGWEPSLDDRTATRVFIAHGRNDPVIGVAFARRARELLEPAGLPLDYRESEAAHNIDPADIPRAVAWLEQTIK